MDPRVKTSVKDLILQHDLSVRCYKNLQRCMDALNAINDKDETLADARKNFSEYSRKFSAIQNILQDSDMPPTTQTIAAATNAATEFEIVWKKFKGIK